MSYRHTAVLLLLLAALPLSAQPLQRGEVLLETEELIFFPPISAVHSWWIAAPQDPWAGVVAFPLIWDVPRFEGRAPMRAFGNGNVLVGDDDTIYRWHGTHTFDPVLKFTNELSEIAPVRSGHFLAAERYEGKLIEFNLKGRVAEYPFPGAEHIELLSDQCTLLFTNGANDNRVRRMNICTGRELSDFALLPGAAYAGTIRQLPNGDVLVADGSAVRRFSRSGTLVGSYPFPGVTHIALFERGTKFYAAGVVDGTPLLRAFDVESTLPVREIPIGNPGMSGLRSERITDLTVEGEWRASAAMMRRRAVR